MRIDPKPTAKSLVLDINEYEAIQATEQVLAEIQYTLGGESMIMSMETGEVIAPGEIPRMRAILDFIFKYRMIEVG